MRLDWSEVDALVVSGVPEGTCPLSKARYTLATVKLALSKYRNVAFPNRSVTAANAQFTGSKSGNLNNLSNSAAVPP
jgi:hypothetical protein